MGIGVFKALVSFRLWTPQLSLMKVKELIINKQV